MDAKNLALENPEKPPRDLPYALPLEAPDKSGKGKKGGIPRNLLPEAPDVRTLERYASAGLSEEQLCYMLDIDKKTLQRWKRLASVKKALREGKANAVKHVESSLYLCCVGYWHEGQRIDRAGNVVSIKQYEPPDVPAIQFYLANRDPENWKLKTSLEASGTSRVEFVGIPEGHKERKALAVEIRKRLLQNAGTDGASLALDGGRIAPAEGAKMGPNGEEVKE
jgi:hypothetical protein